MVGVLTNGIQCARVAAVTVGTLAAFWVASPVSAQTIEPPVYSGTTIKGTDAVGGPPFSSFPGIPRIAIDQVSRSLYVAHSSRVYKFDAEANVSETFSGLAGNTVISGQSMGTTGDLEVDNTDASTQGLIYAFEEFGAIGAYLPSGILTTPPFVTPPGDICGAAVDPDGEIWLNQYGTSIAEYRSNGEPTGGQLFTGGSAGEACDFEIDSQGNFYLTTDWSFGGVIKKFSPSGQFLYTLGEGTSLGLAIDPSNDNVFVNDKTQVEMYSSGGSLLATFGDPAGGYEGLSNSTGIAVDEHSHNVYVGNNRFGSQGVDVFVPGPPVVAPDVTTNKAVPAPTTALLRGTVNPDGVQIQDCYFQWGLASTELYEHEVDCAEGTSFEGSADVSVSASISGLTKGVDYKFRLVAENTNGIAINGANLVFRAQGEPIVVSQFVNGVKGDGVRINAEIDPDKGDTTYYFEYGTDTSYGTRAPIPDGALESITGVQTVSLLIHDLALDTEYHYRVVATNDAGTIFGEDRTLRTFPPFTNIDTCPNALARQQTGAILLDHCRAYELVSATNSGGYNVESDLVPGQRPLPGFPGADGRVLYGVHNGGIPGTGNPTNKGVDPYVAVRGEGGWTTSYVGIPADGAPPASPPFASTFLAADDNLAAFAFGGSEICDPCFDDGSAGLPLRLGNGALVQGMKGSMSQPDAEPAGFVAKPFSADGSHFVFGADQQFEPAGNEGSVSIYDRNLETDVTQVVSTLPGGATMGGEVGQLDISADGSRIVVGQEVSPDAAGNRYWHPYMHIGTDSETIDLAPGSTGGVLYAGMSEDGTKVFFTSTEQLLSPGDGDGSADLYMAEVGSGGGAASLTLLTPLDSDACNPVANVDGNNWNAVGGASTNSCGAVAIGGGGGVAAGDGTVYFFSPEQFGGEGALNEPNLFVVRPGAPPEFVATFDPDDPVVRDSVSDSEQRDTGEFQVSSNGSYAAFSVAAALTGFDNHGRLEVFRYDAAAGDIDCVSCASSGARPDGDAMLASNGVSVIDDGRVFFTTPEPLVLRDTGAKKDAYEWTEGDARLISSGSGPFDAGLLTVSSDGRDVYFFTRDTFVRGDRNGTLMKIYDAREDGGFFLIPPSPPCAASDECHGPGSARPPLPTIGSFAGTPGNKRRKPCRKGKVRKRGKCVRKHRKGRKHRRKSRKHGRRSHR